MPDTLKSPLNRRVGLLTVGLWITTFGFYMSPNIALGDDGPGVVTFQLLCSVVGITLSILLFRTVRATERMAHWPRVTLVGVATLAALCTHAAFDTWTAGHLIPVPPNHRPPLAYVYATNLAMLAPVYGLYITCVALTFSALANRDKERRLAAAHAAEQEARLMALRFQINPHFLFNALNAVTALVGANRNAEASQVVARLSSFFRATLNTPPGEMIRLADELDTIGSYLDIEAARFGARLSPEIDCPEEVGEALVPHFLLQPLVENAIKHGVARSKATVSLVISAEARVGRLVLRVSDDAGPLDGAASAGAGVGQQNVAARLAALYGEAATLTTGRQGRRFVAEIEMPLTYELPERVAA